MADQRITDLTAITGTNLATGDTIEIVDVSNTTDNAAGSSRKTTLADLITALSAARGMPRVKTLTADHSISSTTGTEVTDLSITLEAGTYVVDYYLIVQSATTSVSPLLGINFTGTAAVKSFIYMFADVTSAITAELHTMDDEGVNTFGYISGRATRTYTTTAPNLGSTATLAVSTVDVDIPIRITGLLIVTASGDLELWHSSETATATRVKAGSSLVVVRTA